ncbi:MAG: DMT family transporter [Succinivibrio sp.]|nr:DMT family transporter [Succinivibrio sp.]
MSFLAIFLQSALYGFGDPISKIAYEEMPVATLLGARYAIALGVMLPWCLRKPLRELKELRLGDWLPSCLCIALCYVLSNEALKLTAATSVAFLRSMSVIFTPLAALALLRRRVSLRLIPVSALACAGMYLLCERGGLQGFGAGEGLTLLSALMMALSLVFAVRSLKRVRALTLTALQTGTCALVTVTLALVCDRGYVITSASAQCREVIVYLAVACTIAGFLLQNLALRRISPEAVALLQCSCPVLTALFAALLLNERLSPAGMAGAALIILSVAGAILVERRARRGAAGGIRH